MNDAINPKVAAEKARDAHRKTARRKTTRKVGTELGEICRRRWTGHRSAQLQGYRHRSAQYQYQLRSCGKVGRGEERC